MKPKSHPAAIPAVIVAVALTPLLAFSQTATTSPAAVMEINIAANGYTYIGLPVYTAVRYRGALTAVSGSTISLDDTPFDGKNFGTIAIGTEQLPQFFVEFLSGTDEGTMIPILSSTASSLTLSEDVSSFASVGDLIQVRRFHTLNSLFPDGKPLRGGTSQTTADEVIIYDASRQKSFSHFYFTTANEWRQGTVANGNRPILPNQSIYVNRKTVATKLRVAGTVKLGLTGIDVLPGNNLVPNPYPVAYTLQQSNLFTGNATTGVKSGTSATSADQVTIYGPGLIPRTYFYHSGLSQWRTGTTPSDQALIPIGASILINRRSPSSPFTWTKAQPF